MKVCVATGTRAEYGLLKPLIEKIHKSNNMDLQLLVTGAHLSPEFGLTYKQIEKDGFEIDSKVEMLLSSDTPEGISKSIGLGIIGYADSFKSLKPDILILLGDRYEVLALATAALMFKIPVAHIHGGEITEGAYDEAIRHAVTKMSHLHFTSTETYRNRVIQLGENPEHVFNVGAIGLDNIVELKKLTKAELENKLQIKFNKYNFLLAYHPETLLDLSVESQFQIILNSVLQQEDSFFIFTKANADTDGRVINQMMEKFVSKYPSKAALFSSLGSLNFLSVLENVDAIIGNSSAGIIEAISVRTPTLNIGNRQKGRIQAKSVINCECNLEAITQSIKLIKNMKVNLSEIENPYGDGKTSIKILEILKKINPSSLSVKPFYDL